MKTYVLIIVMILCASVTYGQAYPSNEYKHEIKFNMGLFLVNTTIEGSYEYYFTRDTSIGGTLYFNNDATEHNGNFGIGPNLRAYFGYRPKSGFFAEAFGLYYTGEDKVDDSSLDRNRDYGTTALGLGLGGKWATFGQKLTLEFFGGVGRNLNPEEFQTTFMYRGGFSLGFRF